MLKKVLTKIFSAVILVSSIMVLAATKVNAEELGNPYIDISFDPVAKENKNHGTLDVFSSSSSELYGNSSIIYGVDPNGTYMKWTANKPRGGGFNLNMDKAIGGNYTIALKFSFTNTGEKTGGWKKIIDFQRTSSADSGFYFYNRGQIQFYPNPSQGPYIKNNEVVDLLIRRNATTNKFEVYNRVGDQSILCYEFVDSGGLSVLSAGLGFFHDDYATSSESSPGGKVYSVKIWDTYADVDDVWTALDKEKEESISRYVCSRIDGQDPTDIIPGWKPYYKCEDQVDKSFMYFEDETYSMEILDLESWKEESGYVPQLQSMENIINDLKVKLGNIDADTVKSSDKSAINNIKDTIADVNVKKATTAEQNEFKELDALCDLLLEKIDDIAAKLKRTKEAVEEYSSKKLTKDDYAAIEEEIEFANSISIANLTTEENKNHTANIKKLEELLESIYSYEILEGDNQKFVEGKVDKYILRINGDYSLFDSIEIGDLELLEETDFIVTEGSTIITFTESGIKKLNKLTPKSYTVSINYKNSKKAVGNLLIKKDVKDTPNPKTSDNIISTIIIGFISLIGLAISSLYIKHLNNN